MIACVKNNNHNNSIDNNGNDNTNNNRNKSQLLRTRKKKEKGKPKILTEIKQTNLETNDYYPRTAPTLPLPRYSFLNPFEK